jgi:hypothetical protein
MDCVESYQPARQSKSSDKSLENGMIVDYLHVKAQLTSSSRQPISSGVVFAKRTRDLHSRGPSRKRAHQNKDSHPSVGSIDCPL